MLYQRLRRVLESIDMDWEWIVVDDHLADDTFTVITDFSKGMVDDGK